MSSRFQATTGFSSLENQFSSAHTVASKPPKVVNQQTGELEPDPKADADGYVYETTTGASASVWESGTTNYQSQEKYRKDHHELVSSGGFDFNENSLIQPVTSESHQTQNAWSNGTESYYLAAGGANTVVDDLVTSTSYSRYDIPFSTGFSTLDSNSDSSIGNDSTISVSHVETTTTETMNSESSSRSRSGKDDQGRPFADSSNIEQFDRFTAELTIDYGHVIDKEGSHELPTFYDTETFEAINYESREISSTSFSLTSGARNSQSQRERTTSQGYSITKNGTGRNRSFEIVFMNTDGQVGLDIAFGSYNQSSAFWLIEEETRSNNGRVDHHSKEDSSFNQTYRNYIHKFTQLLSSSPGTYVNSASGTKTGTLTSYLDKDAYLSSYTGGQNQIHIKDGYQVGSKDDVIYQMKQVDDPGSAGGPNIVTLLPTTTVDTEYSFGGDFDGTGSIDAGGTVNWTSVTSESRSNGNVTPGNSDWDASLTLEDYLGSGFGGTFAYIPVDASQDLIQLWHNEFQAPILDGFQQVDPHTPEYAGGRSNDTQFVSEESNGNHNTNYQLNGAYQNLDPNTTIDFETPWGPLSSFKNTEETSSSEPVEEPTEGEGTDGEECDCACGDGEEAILDQQEIAIFKVYDDKETEDESDDELVGYASGNAIWNTEYGWVLDTSVSYTYWDKEAYEAFGQEAIPTTTPFTLTESNTKIEEPIAGDWIVWGTVLINDRYRTGKESPFDYVNHTPQIEAKRAQYRAFVKQGAELATAIARLKAEEDKLLKQNSEQFWFRLFYNETYYNNKIDEVRQKRSELESQFKDLNDEFNNAGFENTFAQGQGVQGDGDNNELIEIDGGWGLLGGIQAFQAAKKNAETQGLEADYSIEITVISILDGYGLAKTVYSGSRALIGCVASRNAGKLSSGKGLVHMTEASDAINRSKRLGLPSDIYAGPTSNAGRSGWSLTGRTGLNPKGNYEAIHIPSSAESAFSRPLPIGPATFWQRVTGQQYSARGIIDLDTGTFLRTGINRTQAQWYVFDTLATSGGLYWWFNPEDNK
ncbi:MAG TPA: hypothetical protein DD473_13815 [Planctomycetaceae bacterium]|nr:hypothetical protein [Planctomycetaceae bacterium]